MKKIYFLSVIILVSIVLEAKINNPPLLVNKLKSPIVLDGNLTEEVYNNEPICNFIQREPNEGELSKEKSCVWISFDESNLYISAMMYDSQPNEINTIIARRDNNWDSDLFMVYLDPYRDKRTGYYFGVNPGGGLNDGILYNDSWDDSRWDGIWEAKTQLTNEGWALEMRIPYSQLRFNSAEEMVWGINISRRIKRLNERSYYVMVPSKESGFVSHFAELKGLTGVKPKQRFELLPYVVQKAQYLQHDKSDPYYEGEQYKTTFGVDLKVGLGSNLNLDVTVNPDFGQVEVDPAVVNLSAFETYYDEKRPFFLEGTNIFEFGWGGVNNHWGFNFSWPSLFYSRRIGQSPRVSVDDDYDYINYPLETRILGAGKLTGKIGESVNIGAFSAFTERTFAKYKFNGIEKEAEVEPFTSYSAFRVQKEFDSGKHSLGVMVTSVNRDLSNSVMKDMFAQNAYTFGFDGWTTLDDDNTYALSAALMGSYKQGSKEFITRLQKAPYRYFQRPDADYATLDTSLTSLSGMFGRVILNKQKGNFYLYSSLGFVSPGFDYNDLGIQFWADKINYVLVSGYRWFETDGLFRRKSAYLAHYRDYDFEGNIYRNGLMLFTNSQFENYYGVNLNASYGFKTYNKSVTRGGPLVRTPEYYSTSISFYSDDRKKVTVYTNLYYEGQSNGNGYIEFAPEVVWKPNSSLSFSFSPSISANKEEAQYVDTFDDNFASSTFNRRYIFGELNQRTIAASIRLDWTFNPQMSLQLFLQPIISVGDYSEFKELAAAKTDRFNVYGHGNSTINYDKNNEEYTVDPDGAGNAETFSFSNPDFNFKSLRGNMVFRWEFLPGSVFYLVWSHDQTNFEDAGQFNFRRDFKNLLNAKSNNVYMAKITYWFDI